METDRKVNGFLKAGIIANGSYLALMLIQFIVNRFAGEGFFYDLVYSGFWVNAYKLLHVLVALRTLIGKFLAPLIQASLAPLIQLVLPLFYIFWFLLIGAGLASLAVSLIGVRHIAAGNRKKGAIMALIGTGMFFPLGIIGMIGAWQELKKVGDSAIATSAPELETGRRDAVSSAAGTLRPSDVRMNTITIVGIVLNCLAALSISLQDDMSGGLMAIVVVPAVTSVIGAALFATGSKKPGLLIIQIGSIVLVPLGLIAVFGANKTMNELKRSQFYSEAQQ